MERYNDEDYDGIVVKIPRALILVNNMDDFIDSFKKELEDKVKLSVLIPDYQKSLNELENWKIKCEEIKKQRAEDKERLDNIKKKREEYNSKLLNREIIEFSYYKTPPLNNYRIISNIIFNNGDNIDLNDYLYPKGKKTFNKDRGKLLCKRIREDLLSDKSTFLKNNTWCYSYLDKSVLILDWEYSGLILTCDKWGDFVLKSNAIQWNYYYDNLTYIEVRSRIWKGIDIDNYDIDRDKMIMTLKK